MEKDNEVHGSTGTSYDFGARIYDPRVGRWLSLDPKLKAGESPYAAFSNSPLFFVDPDGKDTLVVHRSREFITSGKAKIFRITFSVIRNKAQEAVVMPAMYMIANAEKDSKPGNSLSAEPFYKLIERMMPKALNSVGGDLQEAEALFGRMIAILGTNGQFIHAGSEADTFNGCFGVSNMPPLMPGDYPITSAQLTATQDDPQQRAIGGATVEGGMHTLFRVYDEANQAGQLTGDKWLLQPNSQAPMERMAPRAIQVESAPLDRTPAKP